MQDPLHTSRTNSQKAKGSSVPLRTVGVFRAKCLRYRSSLLQSFRQSTLRLVVLEIRSFPHRIAGSINDPMLRYGNTISDANVDRSMGSFDEVSRYSRACIHHIQELQQQHRWISPLDTELIAQSHRAGMLWAVDNLCKKTRDTEPV
jgi:hypothetical protein